MFYLPEVESARFDKLLSIAVLLSPGLHRQMLNGVFDGESIEGNALIKVRLCQIALETNMPINRLTIIREIMAA